ncbi:MAG: glycosyltransferase family 2 protein [Gammaproteobacteria bacterium]|nr:glycosyltransferase family 2 protein [Gammaproteobacteria bacterium]MCP5299901.1 glycosyltransferase family 2 protein [Chromatiaceae bacterium]
MHTDDTTPELSIILPALNEAASLKSLVPELLAAFPDAEIIVVDDGSSDDTKAICTEHGCRVVSNPYRMGNGAAIKRGTRAARGRVLAMLDADGQHLVSDLQRLWRRFLSADLDMVVGARSGRDQASTFRRIGNFVFNRLASWMTGQRIPDLTSGFRVVNAARFREFLHLLPNGFSYPTTSTMAFFRSGYTVAYEPIDVRQREGRSHLKIWREGARFMVIIFKIGALYSPLKLFLPISALLFLSATSLYGYTYATGGRFTNMSALLYMTSLLTFLIGIVSEQITSLMFARRERH